MYYLCFDVGGTITKCAVVTPNYEIVAKSSFPTEISRGGNDLLARMIKKIKETEKYYPLSGVAVSSPGIVDCETGTVVFANERGNEFRGVNYRKAIREEAGLNCWADNDANCFAWAETLHSDCDFLVVTVGTGIGGAIVFDGEVYRGANNSAGAFGQMRITDAAKWEEVASTKSLVEEARKYYPGITDGEDIFARYDRKEEKAIMVVERFYRYLATGLVNLAYIFNPRKILIGGGVTNRAAFQGELLAAVRKIAHPDYFGKTAIEISRYRNDGGAVGALVHYLKREKKIKKSL